MSRTKAGAAMNTERLTPYEKEFAARNHNVIYAYLHDRKLSVDEYYDVVILDYIRAVRRYCREERVQQYSFCTMAWKYNVLRDTRGDNVWEEIELSDRIKEIMIYLTDMQIQHMVLLYEGYKCKEIAEILGLYKQKERESRKELQKAVAKVFR